MLFVLLISSALSFVVAAGYQTAAGEEAFAFTTCVLLIILILIFLISFAVSLSSEARAEAKMKRLDGKTSLSSFELHVLPTSKAGSECQ